MTCALRRSSLSCLAALSMLLMGCAAVFGQMAQRGDDPVETRTVLENVAKQYHTRPIAEKIGVRVTNATSRRVERMIFRSRPAKRSRDWKSVEVNIELDMGDVLLWTDGDLIRATHRLDAGSYFETEAPESIPETLREIMPPLPLPQLDFIFGDAETFDRLTTYAEGIRWATHAERIDPATLRLRGRAGDAVIEVDVHPRSNRLQYFFVDIGQGGTVIDVAFGQSGIERRGLLGMDVEGRTRLDDIEALRARPGDIKPGMELPELLLTRYAPAGAPVGEEELTRPVILGPGVLVFATEWGAGVAAALEGAEAAATEGVVRAVWPVVVHDVGSGEFDEKMRRVAASASPRPVSFSLSTRTTIRRFAAEGDAIMVVIDADNVVRGVKSLDEASTAAGVGAAITEFLDDEG